MITKERLEELIEKGATVYFLNLNEIIELKLVPKNEPEIMYEDRLYVYGTEPNDWRYKVPIKWLFETKEDAEFAYKYQNISTTYYLNLPTYKDFVENYQTLGDVTIPDEKCVMFNFKTNIYSLYATDNEIHIGRGNDGAALFRKDLNKENYIQACDLCRKLFLGEDDV